MRLKKAERLVKERRTEACPLMVAIDVKAGKLSRSRRHRFDRKRARSSDRVGDGLFFGTLSEPCCSTRTAKEVRIRIRSMVLSEEQLEGLAFDDPKARAFRADDRLIKTLLLAALVPEVAVLKGLNSERLAALNHGSVTSPIPGRERQEVLRRLRGWASQVGEIKIGGESDPVINVQLTGVDTEAILENAKVADNPGNRRRKVRELLFEQLGIEDRDDLHGYLSHEASWRGTRRAFQVIFGNVRELTTESLAAKADSRKAILDFPFDDAGHSPAEDIARLDEFRQAEKPSRTLVWLPSFLSVKAQKEL